MREESPSMHLFLLRGSHFAGDRSNGNLALAEKTELGGGRAAGTLGVYMYCRLRENKSSSSPMALGGLRTLRRPRAQMHSPSSQVLVLAPHWGSVLTTTSGGGPQGQGREGLGRGGQA